MKNNFGLIYTGESNMILKDLTIERAVAAVPFGGRYRVIDFALSNLVNSGVTNVGVITQRNYHSLIDHVSSGQAYDLSRKRDGLFILPPFVNAGNLGIYRGTVDAIKASMDYIRRASQRYCIYMGSTVIYNMSYEPVMAQHLETGADVTMIYDVEQSMDPGEELRSDVRLVINERGRVTDMEIGSYRPKSPNFSMDCMIIDKSLLEYLIDEAAARSSTDFVQDVLLKKLDTLKVYSFRHDGHVARMNSAQAFFRSNLDILKEKVRDDLFLGHGKIYTKIKDEVPARYLSTAMVRNSMVTDGCTIGGEVENCILFRGVTVGRGAYLRNCVVMQGCEIQENASLENVILDKAVLVKRDRKLMGHETFPVIIRKKAVI